MRGMWRCVARSVLRQSPRGLRCPSCLSVVLVRRPSWQKATRRALSSVPDVHELFAMPAVQRFLERQQQQQQPEHCSAARAQLAALIRLLEAKEQELRDTERLAREGEPSAVLPGTLPAAPTGHQPHSVFSPLPKKNHFFTVIAFA